MRALVKQVSCVERPQNKLSRYRCAGVAILSLGRGSRTTTFHSKGIVHEVERWEEVSNRVVMCTWSWVVYSGLSIGIP